MSDKEDNKVVDTSITIERTLIEVIKDSLINEEIKNALTIKLTPELNQIISKLLSLTPNSFNEIEIAVLEIIKDNKINTKDIPQFIIIVQKIYEIIYSIKDTKIDSKKCAIFTASCLKYIIHLLVLERKIKIDNDKQEQFLGEIDALIDACINLINFSGSIKIKGCCKKIFG